MSGQETDKQTGGQSRQTDVRSRQERSQRIMDFKQKINEMLAAKEYHQIKPLLLSDKDITEHDNDLAMVCYLCTIYEQEQAAGKATIFDKITDMESLLERYNILKFYLRRIDFGVMDDMGMFYQFLSQSQVSSYELLRVIDFSVVHRDMVLQAIGGGTASEETETGAAGHIAEEDKIRETEAGDSSCSVDENAAGQAGTGNHMVRDDEEDAAANQKQGDPGRICFIICTNNNLYAQECIYYINHLTVPEGMQVEILTVEEAKSLTAGYNEAMQCSDAKYKVYLHHDTFIINPDFIGDCLTFFRKNPQVGMLGNVGVAKMPASGVMWDADRYGMLYEQHIYETALLANALPSGLEYLEAEAVDGFLMVTQYDIPWREDLFTGWDFYDCSQSMEFIRKGYQVAVPYMNQPWCVHDCGFINLEHYDGEKEKYIEEYLKDRK